MNNHAPLVLFSIFAVLVFSVVIIATLLYGTAISVISGFNLPKLVEMITAALILSFLVYIFLGFTARVDALTKRGK